MNNTTYTVIHDDEDVRKSLKDYSKIRRDLLMSLYQIRRDMGDSAMQAYEFVLNVSDKAAENAKTYNTEGGE